MLTDLAIRKAKPREKGYKIADERSFFLFISPTGAKSFRWKYAYAGKEKVLTFGQWPDITLTRARELVTVARGVLAEGHDPGVLKRQTFAARITENATTLEQITREWHGKQATRWTKIQAAAVIRSLERDIFPSLGSSPIASINVSQLRSVLSEIESRGAIETAHRIRRRLDNVWTYAIATDRAKKNPAEQLKGTLTTFSRSNKQPAALTIEAARHVYKTASAYPAAMETRSCFQFQALTAVRPGDARGAEWTELSDLDGSKPEWRVPAARMKGSVQHKANPANDHIVPLSPEAVAILRAIQSLTGFGKLIFPSPRYPKRPLTDLALSMLLRRAGFEGRHVPHGWRASFSTIMNDRHPSEAAVIDAALSHQVKGVEGRYNRAKHLERRRDLLAEWAALITNDGPTALPGF